MTTEQEQWYIFTFGSGRPNGGHYVKFFGTYGSARQQMFDTYGEKWGFQYSQEEWDKVVERLGSFAETELK